jgi:arylformamidase
MTSADVRASGMGDGDARDAAWFEREYSPSSVIGGDYAPYIARYVTESEHARATVAAQVDVAYGVAATDRLDFFGAAHQADDAARPGLLVFFHGGYWQELSKHHSSFAVPAWHGVGSAVAVVGYPLAPSVSLEEIVVRCSAAIDWLLTHADDLGFDRSRVVVAGSSAGAYLAAAVGARCPVAGMVLVSGIYDVAPLMGTTINDALGLDELSALRLDLLHADVDWPPAVVAWGEHETNEFKRQSREFSERCAAEAFEVAERNHFDVVLDLGDPSSRLFQAAARLMGSTSSVSL